MSSLGGKQGLVVANEASVFAEAISHQFILSLNEAAFFHHLFNRIKAMKLNKSIDTLFIS